MARKKKPTTATPTKAAEQPQKRGRGAPTAYKSEYVRQAVKLASIGATDMEMADFFNVDVRTIYRWRNTHADFCQALRVGKDIADERVTRSLYQKAVGYEQDDVKIFMPAGGDRPVYAPYVAKVAPDTTAAIFWLKNRRPAEWRDKQDIALSGDIAINITPDDQAL